MRRGSAVEGLLEDWREASAPQRVLLGVLATLCLVTPASNYSPGRFGYMLLAVVVTIAIVMVREHGLCSGWPGGRLVTFALLGLGVWGALSLLWADPSDVGYAALQWYLVVVACALPWMVASQGLPSGSSTTRWIGSVALVVVGCSAVVAPYSWLTEPGWRLALPLGGASTSPVALVLCMAALYCRWRVERRLIEKVGLLVGGALLVATVSRIGFFMAIVLGVAVVARDRGKVPLALTGAASLASVIVLLALRGGGVISDAARGESASTAWAQMQGWRSFLMGRGWGGVWEWLAFETRHLPMERQGVWLFTDDGRLLYHAHSVYLNAFVELGLVGLVLLAAVLIVVARGAVSSVRQGASLWPVAVALLLSLLAFAFETYLFHSLVTSMVWWIMAFALVTSSGRSPVQ